MSATNGAVTRIASERLRASIRPSTAMLWPDAARTGCPSMDSTRQTNFGDVAREPAVLMLGLASGLAACKTSMGPATPDARIPSKTQKRTVGMMSEFPSKLAILPLVEVFSKADDCHYKTTAIGLSPCQ